MSLIDNFFKKNIINERQVFSVSNKVEKEGVILDQALEDLEINPDVIFDIKKQYYENIPTKEFDQTSTLSETLMDYIPIESAERYKIVPLGISEDDYLEVGMLDPEDLTAKTTLQFISTKIGKPYRVFIISLSDYKNILKKYKGVKGEVSKALDQYIDIQESENPVDDLEKDIIREDAPIAKIVSNIIKGAAEKKASDIHVEVNENEIQVRYRIDGILQKSLVLPKDIHRAVTARIKILSKIKIDEKRKPQDGRFSGNFLNRKIDFRVSTFPTYYGEKVVMRLLEQERGALPVEEIGFSPKDLEHVKKIIKKSYGIILICGPTGSGKTNTLYSLLNQIDKKSFNVVSLENPIEMNINGVSQSQVRHDIGYTFATGLRAILRQDPDIIMVGEIRDEETASLAIEAALTGHLVFSTIHTNTAADVPQRLVDMGVEPYLIGPTLIASIGQRLIRKLVPEHKVQKEITPDVKKFVEEKTKQLPEEKKVEILSKNLMYGVNPNLEDISEGLSGRTAVFEILEVDENIRRTILKDPSSLSILSQARKNGYNTFLEDGIFKALDGVTTFEEVMKL